MRYAEPAHYRLVLAQLTGEMGDIRICVKRPGLAISAIIPIHSSSPK